LRENKRKNDTMSKNANCRTYDNLRTARRERNKLNMLGAKSRLKKVIRNSKNSPSILN